MQGSARKSSRFPETRWSLVGRATTDDEATRRAAVTQLLEIYRPALRAFLVQSRRMPEDLADDVLHDFVADRILAKEILDRANSERGRFRNFLAKSLSNFASTRWTAVRRRDARAADLDEATLQQAASTIDTERFDQEWVATLVRDALALMEADCRERGRMDHWEVLHMRAVAPLMEGAAPVSYQEIVDAFGLETPRQAINLLATAKRAFLRHLRTAVGRYVEGEEEVEREIADLREIVGR